MKKILSCVVILFFGLKAVAGSISIPLGGNAWVHGGNAAITNDGLTNWADAKSITTVYFHMGTKGSLQAALRLRVPAGQSKLVLKINGHASTQMVSGAGFHEVNFGSFAIKDIGYVKAEISGMRTTGKIFADVSDLVITGVDTALVHYVPNNEGNFFHWGRRGPSVHLVFHQPAEYKLNTDWFYSEVKVPVGMDKIGSYFMADGFSFGYFGMQVNSATERRVLFSVWSPEVTDDPNKIPEDKRIKLLKKGANVHAGEFGNEGSGGQSYLIYPWQAFKTYCFLLHAQSDTDPGNAIFTAWFKEKDAGDWQLIASFKRPQTIPHLSGLYSFLENFEPDNGDQDRLALYGNQWIAKANGSWLNLNEATFSIDNTARKGYRLDYGGGVDHAAGSDSFYLRNGGFFNNRTPKGLLFKRAADTKHPDIDFDKLP